MSVAQVIRDESHSSRSTHAPSAVVCIVDDDIVAREALESLVCAAGWEAQTFSSAEEFLERPAVGQPRCLLLDVSLPNLDGLALQQRVAKDRGETPVIFVTNRADVSTAVRAMKGGASEFFTRPFEAELLLNAVSEGIERSRIALARGTEKRTLRARYASLTPRERQVMDLVAAGRLNKQIGIELEISEITVKAHRGSMMRKMNARTVPDLVKMVAKLELDESPAS